jgi:hypothetical protein
LVLANTGVAGFAVAVNAAWVSLIYIVMRVVPERAGNRREFFRAAARYGLLGLLGIVGGTAIRRRSLAGQDCINQGICPRCGILATCGLPQALSVREFESLNKNESNCRPVRSVT